MGIRVLADEGFGSELRRLRTAAGLSLRELAKKVHFTHGHLSKVETGEKVPSVALARQCDIALKAEGRLASMVREMPAQRHARRQHSAQPVELVLPPVPGNGSAPATLTGSFIVAGWDFLRNLRAFGQMAPASAVLPVASAAAKSMQVAATRQDVQQRAETLVLASRFAEYAGWMAQETGDDDMAMRWTDIAVNLAARGGDQVIAAYSLVRRGLVALYRRNARETIRYAQQAQRMTDDVRVCGLAAQREAQGYALAGDSARCWEALDRAAALLSEAASARKDDAPIIGMSHVADPVLMVRGWCQHDLGDSLQATQTLAAVLAATPQTARRSRSLIGARLALSLAALGEVDEACAVAGLILHDQQAIESATIRTDLRRLNAALGRWHRHPTVRWLAPELAAAARQIRR